MILNMIQKVHQKYIFNFLLINIKHEKSVLSDLKPIKTGKILAIAYCFGCKDYTKNFRPEKVNMTNNVVREKVSLYCLSV